MLYKIKQSDEMKELRIIKKRLDKLDRRPQKYLTKTFLRLALGESKTSIAKSLGVSASSITVYAKKLAKIVTDLIAEGELAGLTP